MLIATKKFLCLSVVLFCKLLKIKLKFPFGLIIFNYLFYKILKFFTQMAILKFDTQMSSINFNVLLSFFRARLTHSILNSSTRPKTLNSSNPQDNGPDERDSTGHGLNRPWIIGGTKNAVLNSTQLLLYPKTLIYFPQEPKLIDGQYPDCIFTCGFK